MRHLLNEILPNLRKVSEKLDNIALLSNNCWVDISLLPNIKRNLFFKNNNELIISENGLINYLKWEILNKDLLIIHYPDKSILFKHGFLDKNIFILKIDGTSEIKTFINESRISSELNSLEDVENYIKSNYINEIKQNHHNTSSALNKKDFKVLSLKNKKSSHYGWYTEIHVHYLPKNKIFIINSKASDGSYFIILNHKIKSFNNADDCLLYLLSENYVL